RRCDLGFSYRKGPHTRKILAAVDLVGDVLRESGSGEHRDRVADVHHARNSCHGNPPEVHDDPNRSPFTIHRGKRKALALDGKELRFARLEAGSPYTVSEP